MPLEELVTAALALELRETLGRVTRRLRAEPGPSVGRLAVLGRLEREGPLSMSDLAVLERVRQQSMARTVADLEGEGLISRRPDPTDGRRAFIEITAAGRDVLTATRAGRETWLTTVLERDLDSAERVQLQEALALLRRIAEA
jgi:DNA-binding MarR family transcriptional regulator